MRIDISTTNNISKTDIKKLNNLKQGDVIKARIIEVKGDVAKIDLGNGEIVHGKLDVPFDLLKDKVLNFVIKDVKDNMLLMSPVYEDIDFSSEFVLKNKNLIMDRILNLNNLSKDDKNLSIIKNMIAYKMPLDPLEIETISNYTDKLLALINSEDAEEIRLVTTNEPLEENISKLIKVESPESEANIKQSSIDESNTEKQNIKTLNPNALEEDLEIESENTLKQTAQNIVENKDTKASDRNEEFKSISIDFLNKQKISAEDSESNIIKASELKSKEVENLKKDNKIIHENAKDNKVTEFKDILTRFDLEDNGKLHFKQTSDQIKSEIKNLFPPPIKIEDIVQKLTFLVKSDLEVNIKNLSKLNDFLENNKTLDKEIIGVLEVAEKEGIIDEKTKFEILEKTKTIDLKFDGKDSEKLSKFYSEIREISEKLMSDISSTSKSSEELNVKVKNLNENIEFFNKINDKATMMLIPFTLNNKQIENSLYILSKKKISKKSDNIKVYMALNTNNLDNVKILCDFSYDRLNVNFKVNKDHMKLFENSKEELKTILENNGYDNTFIYVNKEEEKEKVLDLISYDETINYMLNIKV